MAPESPDNGGVTLAGRGPDPPPNNDNSKVEDGLINDAFRVIITATASKTALTLKNKEGASCP